MRVNWTAQALRRLQQLHDYIAKDQPLDARRFVDKLTQRTAELAEQSQTGLRVPKYAREDVRQVFEGDYRIVYRILSDRIDIVTVRHMARLLPSRMRDL